MSTLTRTSPLTTPGGLQYPKITVFVTIPNTGRRAAARQDALARIVRAYGAELRLSNPSDPLEHWGRLDKSGDRTVMLSGERELVELLETYLIPSMIERMERAAGAAMKIFNRRLRATGSCKRDLPFMRRRFRAAFLRSWGQAFEERAAALETYGEPAWIAELPELAEDAEPSALTEARRAVAGLDPYDAFTRGASSHARAARQRVAEFEAACVAAGTTPDEVLEIQHEAQNDHVFGPIELGEIEHGEIARLILALGDHAGLAEARAEVLGPILSAVGVRHQQGAADRWGQIVLSLAGPDPAVGLIHARAAVILERAELTARIALQDVYAPYVRRFSHGGTPYTEANRRTWRADFLRGWGRAFADRLVAALDGRSDAPRRYSADPETVGTVPTHDRAGRRVAVDEYGAAYGHAAVERMDAVEFTALAAELGGTALLSAPAIEQMAAPVVDVDQDAQHDARLHVPNIDGRGRDRIAALTPVLGVYGQQIERVQAETSAYGAELATALYVTITGPADLAGAAGRAAAALIPVMDRAADRAARHAKAGEAYVTAYREAWGQAYAARIAAALAGDVDALAELPDEQPGPAYLAALAVDDLAAAEVHQAAVTLVIAPGPSGHLAVHRSRAVADLAEVYGLAAWPAGRLDREAPTATQRELVTIAGPAALVEHVTRVAGEQLAAADALISQLLPAFEQQLDQRWATRRNGEARRVRRIDFTAGTVREYLRAYGERVTAQLAGRIDNPRRVAGEQLDERAAYTAVYTLDPAAVTEAAAELLAAWLLRLAPATAEPAPALLIVPCGKAKRATASPAHALYTGSPDGSWVSHSSDFHADSVAASSRPSLMLVRAGSGAGNRERGWDAGLLRRPPRGSSGRGARAVRDASLRAVRAAVGDPGRDADRA